jgi:transposase
MGQEKRRFQTAELKNTRYVWLKNPNSLSLAEMKKLGSLKDMNFKLSLKDLWTGIINYAETKISNGVLEGINSLVQSAKSCARGFRTTKNFILIIYLGLGKLQFNLPT